MVSRKDRFTDDADAFGHSLDVALIEQLPDGSTNYHHFTTKAKYHDENAAILIGLPTLITTPIPATYTYNIGEPDHRTRTEYALLKNHQPDGSIYWYHAAYASDYLNLIYNQARHQLSQKLHKQWQQEPQESRSINHAEYKWLVQREIDANPHWKFHHPPPPPDRDRFV